MAHNCRDHNLFLHCKKGIHAVHAPTGQARAEWNSARLLMLQGNNVRTRYRILVSSEQQHRENKGGMHSINNEAISRIKLKRQKAWLQLAIVAKYCVCCQLSEQVYILPFRKQLNQALLRKDMHILSCKSRPEHRRQRICAAILRSIWLSKLVPEVAHTGRSGNRRGSTQVNKADFWITVASVGERERWG